MEIKKLLVSVACGSVVAGSALAGAPSCPPNPDNINNKAAKLLIELIKKDAKQDAHAQKEIDKLFAKYFPGVTPPAYEGSTGDMLQDAKLLAKWEDFFEDKGLTAPPISPF